MTSVIPKHKIARRDLLTRRAIVVLCSCKKDTRVLLRRGKIIAQKGQLVKLSNIPTERTQQNKNFVALARRFIISDITAASPTQQN